MNGVSIYVLKDIANWSCMATDSLKYFMSVLLIMKNSKSSLNIWMKHQWQGGSRSNIKKKEEAPSLRQGLFVFLHTRRCFAQLRPLKYSYILSYPNYSNYIHKTTIYNLWYHDNPHECGITSYQQSTNP